MSYLGVVPSEYSSGASRRQGAITKSGNKHARRILVEAAWNNRFKAQVTRTLQVRQEGQPMIHPRDRLEGAAAAVQTLAQPCNAGRKLPQNKICVAIARELCGFIWDLARHVTDQSRLSSHPSPTCLHQEVHPRSPDLPQLNTESGTRCVGPMRGTLVSFIGAACRTACVLGVISASRPRQPREEEMKCGTQPADIRMIHRRSHCPRFAFPVRCRAHQNPSTRS